MSARTDVLLWANRVVARKGSAPHVLLEIQEHSTAQQVQEAFHKVARTSHPDLHRHGLNAEELELVTSAYATVAGAYQHMRAMVALRLRAAKPGEEFATFTPAHPRPTTPGEGARTPTPPTGARTPTKPDFAPAEPKPGRGPTKPDFAPAEPKPGRGPTKPGFAPEPNPGRGPTRNDATPTGVRAPDKVASGSNAPGEIRPITRPTTPPASGETEPKPGRGPTRNDFASPEPRTRPGFPRAGTDADPPNDPKPGRGPTRNDFGSPEQKPGRGSTRNDFGSTAPKLGRGPTKNDFGSPPARPTFPRAGTGADPPSNEPKPASVKASGSSPPASAFSGSPPVTPTGSAQNASTAMSSKALLYYRKAELCLARGDLRGAVLQLKLACAADPSSAFLRTALAEVEIEVRGKP